LAKATFVLIPFYAADGKPLLVAQILYYDREGNLLQKLSAHKDKKTGQWKKMSKDFKNPLPLYKHVRELPFYHLVVKSKK
jgi:hypothetical protein